MVIPREGDKVRLYIQLSEADVIVNGRVDKSQMSAEKLLEASFIFHSLGIFLTSL